MPSWVVHLYIYGPITVKEFIRLNEPKGFRLEDPFYSDIELRGGGLGVLAHITARASTSQLAHKAALFFFGQMLDCLALHIDQPLYISLFERQPIRPERHSVQRIVEQEEWRSAFREARLLALAEPTFLRALGWYRKGLYTEDPFDKFLGFWNSIEVVAGKYHPQNEEAKKGSKSQIWECFKPLWGECDRWPIITGDLDWIDNNHELRNNIAHGIASIDIKRVEEVLEKISTIQQVAYGFLRDWRERQLNPQIPADMEQLFRY